MAVSAKDYAGPYLQLHGTATLASHEVRRPMEVAH